MLHVNTYTKFRGRTVKLGRRPSSQARMRAIPKLHHYIRPRIPPAPAAADWSQKFTQLTVMGNDAYGDCVFAAIGHLIQGYTANETAEVILPDKTIVSAYLDYTGGADDGADIATALEYFRVKGVGSHFNWAYAGIDPSNHEFVKATCASSAG